MSSWEQPTTKLCEWCEEPFIPKGPKKLCSPECVKARRIELNKERGRRHHQMVDNKYYKTKRAEADENNKSIIAKYGAKPKEVLV